MAELFEPAHTFVETGTYEGKTLRRAIESGLYRRLVSVEFDRGFYEKVANEVWPDEVEIHYGDSPKILSEWLDSGESTLFYLDAHKTGTGKGETTVFSDRYGECPLMAELEVIRYVPWVSPPVIKIHDSKMFCHDSGFWKTKPARLFDESQWPTDDEILKLMDGYSMELDGDFLVLRRMS